MKRTINEFAPQAKKKPPTAAIATACNAEIKGSVKAFRKNVRRSNGVAGAELLSSFYEEQSGRSNPTYWHGLLHAPHRAHAFGHPLLR